MHKRSDEDFQRLFDEALRNDDPTTALGLALEHSGARVTFDPDRSIAKPCVRCGTTSTPRDLVTIATWTRSGIGGHQAGDALTRPLCAPCEDATMPDKTAKTPKVEDLTRVPEAARTHVLDVELSAAQAAVLQEKSAARGVTLEEYARGVMLTAAAVENAGGSSSSGGGTA